MGLLTSEHATQSNGLKRLVFSWVLWCFVVPLCLAPGSSLASSSAIDDAVTYLISQQTDGYWSGGDKTVVDTIEVIEALEPHSNHQTVLDALNASLPYVKTLDETHNDVLARKLWVLAHTYFDTDDLISVLLAAQNEDGGWGLREAKQSNVLDTILVVDALLQDMSTYFGAHDDELATARDFIITSQEKQDPSGCWILADEEAPSDVARTAMALIALKDIEPVSFPDFSFIDALIRAKVFLESQDDANGWFGTCADTALAYSALLRDKQPYEIQDSLYQLLKRQRKDGSWGDDTNDVNDIFTTALVLQALNAVSPPEFPYMADLAVYDDYIQFDPPAPNTGQDVNITAYVINEGGTGAPDFYVEFYNGHPLSGGTPIGDPCYIAWISPGSVAEAKVTYTNTGSLYDEQLIVVVVDPNHDVNESDEYNNYATRTLTFGGAQPDLKIDSNDIKFYTIDGNELSGTPDAYEPVVIVVEVINQGSKIEDSFDVNILDLNSPSFHTKFTFNGLAHGSKETPPYIIALPQGGHTFKVTLDPNSPAEPNGAIVESNENNNTDSNIVDVGAGPTPDGWPALRVNSSDILLSNTTALPPDEITITVTIHNDGGGASGNFHIWVTDGNPYAAGKTINKIEVTSIPADSNSVISVGSYQVEYRSSGNEIFVVADCNGVVTETNKSDNVASKKVQISDLPDLTTSADSIKFSHMDLVLNPNVRLSATVFNVGANDVTDVLVQFGIRNDDEAEPEYKWFGPPPVDLVVADGAVDVDTIWQPQGDVNYTVCVSVDHYDEIDEANEYNNTATLSNVNFNNPVHDPNILLYLGDSNQPTETFGAFDSVRIDVNLVSEYEDTNEVWVYLFVYNEQGDFFQPQKWGDSWSFSTGAMEPNAGFQVELAVVHASGVILQRGTKNFTIEPEKKISSINIQTNERFLRLGNLRPLTPAVSVYSSSNLDVNDATVVIELRDPNNDVVYQWMDGSTPFTFEPALTEMPGLGPYEEQDLSGPGDYKVYVEINYVDHNSDPQMTSDYEILPVIPALGFNVFKSLSPESLDPAEHATVDVRIDLDSSGVVMDGQLLDVVLLIDHSGSMEGEKLEAAKDAATDFAYQLLPPGGSHQIAVVPFASDINEQQPLTSDFAKVEYAIDNLKDVGSENYQALGIWKATEILSKGPPDRKRVTVLLTDAWTSFPWYDDYVREHADAAAANDVTIIAIGYTDDPICERAVNCCPWFVWGCGIHESLLQDAANRTGGSYYRSNPDIVGTIYNQVYQEIANMGVESVHAVDKVNRDPNDPNRIQLDIASITPTPRSIDANESEWTIIWDISSMEIYETLRLGYQVDLYDLEPGEERVVNKHLDVTAYNAEANELLTLEFGPQSVTVTDDTTLRISTDKPDYWPNEWAKLAVTFDCPADLEHALFTTQADFETGETNQVDTWTSPGNLILEMNETTLDFPPSGTLEGLIVDAGSGADWGNIEFRAWNQYEFYNRVENYVRSNRTHDVYFYERETTGDAWWQDAGASWYTEANDTIVDHALITEEGWVVSVPHSTRLDDEMDSNDFTIEGWISSGRGYANAVLFYRGDGDANYLCIYKQDVAGTGTLFVDYNSATDSNSRSVALSGDDDDWHYVALTVSNRSAKLYVDGNDVNNSWTYDVNVMSALAGMPVLIGGEPNSADANNFLTVPCRIDEVSIYNRALDANDIGRHIGDNLAHQPAEDVNGLVAYWNFDPSPQDRSETDLGGVFAQASLADPYSAGLRRITGRSSEPNFPENSYIVATSDSVDIIDADSGALWMRFLTDREVLWNAKAARPSCVFALDGKIYVGQDSRSEGLAIIDFKQDEFRIIETDGVYRPYAIIPENMPSQGLVAHWKLDEGSGTTAYDSAGDDDGTLAASPSDPCWTNGYVGGALKFDNNSWEEDYVSLPSIPALGGNTVTIATWVKPDTLGDYHDIFSQYDEIDNGYMLSVNGSNPRFWLSWSQAYSPNIIYTNTWYHLAGTYDGSYLKLYVNGILEANTPGTGLNGVDEPARIGFNDEWGGSFDGIIDDIWVYDRALDANEFYNALNIKDRFENKYIQFEKDTGTDVNLPNGYINDVMAAKIGDANYVAVATRAGVALIQDENDVYNSDSNDWASRVFLTANNDLYFVGVDSNGEGDSLYAVYDVNSRGDNFEPNAIYGYEDQNDPNLLQNRIADLFVTAGTSPAGDNTLYIATSKGLVQIQENQSDRGSGTRKIYLSSDCNDFVHVLAGDSNNVTAVYVDEDANQLWIGTSAGTPNDLSGVGALSIIDLTDDNLIDSLTAYSTPPLPMGTINALTNGLLGTSGGALMFEPISPSQPPVSIRARCINTDNWQNPGEAVSDWTDWFSESGTSVMDANIIDANSRNKPSRSQYLELQVKLTRGSDPKSTPVLEWVSVGYNRSELVINVAVEDADGGQVPDISIPQILITDEHMGSISGFERSFIADVPPGGYNAVATLVDQITNDAIKTAKDDFIIKDVPLPGTVSSSITTNLIYYYAGDLVTITSTVINESNSVPMDDLQVRITVEDRNLNRLEIPDRPGSGPQFTYRIDSLQPGDAGDNWHRESFQFFIERDWPAVPDYNITQEVGQGSVILDEDSATFAIKSNCDNLTALSGSISVAPERFVAGTINSLDIIASATNTGNVDLQDVILSVKFDDRSGSEPNTIYTSNLGDLSPGVRNGPALRVPDPNVFEPNALDPNTYILILSAEFKCGDSNEVSELALTGFTVDEPNGAPNATTPEYIVIDLGAVDDGNSFAYALNNYGNVTGYAEVDGNSHAFCWKCGEMTDLDPNGVLDNSVGRGINRSEQIAGHYYTTSPTVDANAFMWEDYSFTDLGTPDSYPINAYGINIEGQITGYYTLSAGGTRAFVWHNPPNDSPYWQDLNNSEISDANNFAFAINKHGDLAGYWENGQDKQGFISHKLVVKDVGQYTEDGNYYDTYLQGIQNTIDINDEPLAVGYYDHNGTDKAIRYQNNDISALGSLGAGGSRAYSINAEGDVVGSSAGKAFVWRDGAINNLNNHLALQSTDPDWWDLTDAYAINEEGQIVGFGTIDGNTHAFRLDPLPFPVTEPNLVLWLRADTGVVKNTTDPNLVAKWIDQTYSGHDLEQADANYQPKWVSDIPCCNPAIRFDGIDDYLSTTLSHDGNSTILMAVATSSQETGTLFASEDGNNQSNAFELEVADANLRLSTGTTPNTYDISTEATESVILAVVSDGTNVDFFKNGRLLNIDGTAIGQNEAKKYTHCILGKNRDGNQFLDYDVSEVLVFAGALSDTHRQQVEDYLTSKHRLYGPANIEQPALWYKADAGVTMDGNDMVSKWADQSTSVPPHDATQDDPCRQPKWEDNVFECQPAILFDGSVIDTNTVYGPIDTYIVMDRSSSMDWVDYDNPADDPYDPRRRIDFAKDAARAYAVSMLGGEPGPFLQDNGPNHIVSIEAEHFHDNITEGSDRPGNEWKDAWVLDTSKNGYSGDGAIQAKPDDGDDYNCPTCYSKSPRLDFHVNFVETGTHYVWVRGYADDSGSNSCHAGLHKKPTPTADKIEFNTYDQYVWTNGTIDGPNATFDVNVPGVNTVNIRMYDDGFRIDKIVLTTNPDYTPVGNGPAESARGESVPPTESGHKVGLIGFANYDTTFTFQPLTSDLNDIKGAINGLLTNFKTCYKTGIELMTDEFNDDANGSPEGQNRICLFVTDGWNCCPTCDDPGDNELVLQRVEEAVASGVEVWTVGVGSFVDPNHDDYVPARKQFLDDIAETGGGSSVTTPEPSELEAIFLELYYEIVEMFSRQTLSLVFKTRQDVSTRQVLWALGDPNNVGFNVYIDANELYLNAWSVEDGDGNGPETVWGPNHISAPIESNTPYLVDFVYDHTKSTIEGYLNGDYFDAVTGAGKLFPRESRIAIGNNPNQPTRFHDDSNDVNKPYSGYIAEILHYDKALSEQQRRDLDLYLSDKYGFGIRRNSPPTPNAPSDFIVDDNDWDGTADVNLPGDAYDDGNELDLTYRWYENGVLIAEGKNPTVELSIGTHTIELWVTDEDGETSIDTFVVTVKDVPSTLDSRDLTAHWKFDQDSNDSSGNEFDANVVNAQEPNCWSGGKLGSAIKLSADSNEYVDLNGDSNNVKYFPGGAHARTIMGWFEAGDNPNPTFFDYGTADSNNPGTRFAITASSTRLAVTIGSNSHVVGTENFYPLTGWHHIAVVFPDRAEHSGEVKIYLDGARQAICTLDNSGPSAIVNTNTWDNAAYAYIGRDWEGNYFNGRIDDVRLYARALRDAEIPAVRAAQTRYRVIDLGMLEPTGNPQASEAWAINDQGDVVGMTTIYLEPNSPYYWRIDEKNKCEVTEGDTWNFTTGSDLE